MFHRKGFATRSFGFFLASLSITNWLVLINIISFFAPSIGILAFNAQNIYDFVAIKPANILAGNYIWTFATSMFSHAGFFHLFVNMLSLFFIGSFVEKIIGRKRFLWFYLLSGLFAGIMFVALSLIFKQDLNTYAVGASGAIFGIAGLLAVLTPRLPVLVFFIIPMPMWLAVIFLLAGLWALSYSFGLPIGNTAHLGGAIAGFAYGFYLRIKYAKKVQMLGQFFR